MDVYEYLRDRYDWSTARARAFLPNGLRLKCGKGRDTLLHPTTMAETLAIADVECPQAADTIRVLLWQHSLHAMSTMQVVDDMTNDNPLRNLSAPLPKSLVQSPAD